MHVIMDGARLALNKFVLAGACGICTRCAHNYRHFSDSQKRRIQYVFPRKEDFGIDLINSS